MTDTKKPRTAVEILIVTVLSLSGIATYEGYTDKAVIPVKGDVPTIGHGTTVYGDGSRVKIGDTTTPARAMENLTRDTNKFALAVRRCAPVPMYQYEFDAYVSFAYNVGEGAFCSSTLASKLKSLDYIGACKEILRWDKAGGRTVRGLTIRRMSEYNLCIGPQQI